jgi:hypothetical protein
MRTPVPDDQEPVVVVHVGSGEQLARAVHAAALELAHQFGTQGTPIAFDRLPGRQRLYMIATMDLALRRIAMQEDAGKRAPSHRPAAKQAARS